MSLILETFMFIFRFKLGAISFLNSTILLGTLFFFKFIINSQYRTIVVRTILNYKVVTIYGALSSVLVYSFLVIIVHNTNDFSALKPLIYQIVYLLIGCLLFANCVEKGKETSLLRYMIYAFVLQAILQILSFSFETLCNIFNFFRSSEIIEVQVNSQRIRGNAFAAMDFFGLAAAYGIIYIILPFEFRNMKKELSVTKWAMLFLLMAGGLMAARTSLIGMVIGILLLICLHWKKLYENKMKICRKSIAESALLSIAVLLIFILFLAYGEIGQSLRIQLQKYFNWAFEAFINFFQGNGISTSSSDILLKKMYFPIPSQTLLFGDGRYTGIDGLYYMHTDAGYMRNILFFGVIGFLFIFIYQLQFFVWKKQKKKTIFLNCIFIFYFLVLHIKGNVVGFSTTLQSMMLLICLQKIYLRKKSPTLL